jgi:membrane protease YdiL (CAAX protease family)
MALVAVVLAGNFHTLHMPASPLLCIKHYGGYALWAFIQQFGLQCFFLSRLMRLLPDGKSAAATAAILFATVHLPSPLLMLAALIWGFVTCLLFLEYRSIYPLAIAHAVLGIALGISVPAQADHNMLVGLSYFKYMHNAAKAPALSQP